MHLSKRARALLLVSAFLAIAATPARLAAQDPGKTPDARTSAPVRVVLTDGSSQSGWIVSENAEEIRLRTASGIVMSIPRSQISAIEFENTRGSTLRADPARSRLFFSPTARGLDHGTGYVALYEIFFPFVAVGVADVATLAGGVSIIPGSSQQLLYAAPKVTFLEKPNVAVAVGAFAATITGEGGNAGLAYAVTTYGSQRASMTTGVGFLFGNGEFVDTPIILLGGEYQLSNNIKLLSENYFIPEATDATIFSGGIRFMGDKLSADFGLFTYKDAFNDGGFPFLPWIGFAYRWR